MILVGKRIKELRNKAKLTQTELAEKIGVTKSSIAAYENDSRTPSYEVLVRMANVFKVSTDSIILNRSENTIDISGLNPEQINIIENLISYFRKSELIDAFYSKDPVEYERLMKKYPEIFKDENKK